MDLLTFFANPSVKDIGAVVILAMVALMVFTGRLVPKSTHNAIVAASNKRGDEWREAAVAKDSVIAELTEQNSTLVRGNRTAAEFFGTVQRDGGGKGVAQASTSNS